jgi:hypothetical protein
VLSTAVRVGVVDAVADGASTPKDVAARLGVHVEAVRRLLQCLAVIGVVSAADGAFVPTPMLSLLRRGEPGSLVDLALLGDVMYRAWAGLAGTIVTGESAFETAFGEPLFLYLREHPDIASAFNGTMSALSHTVVDAFVAGVDVGDASRIVDLGGGLGHLGATLACAYPHIDVIVFDLPQVEAEATAFLADHASDGRCRFEAGNFFTAVPAGADVYVLKWVLHDWGDDRCLRILQNCRAALPPDGRIVIIERLIPDRLEAGPESNAVLRFDMSMLALGGVGTARNEHSTSTTACSTRPVCNVEPSCPSRKDSPRSGRPGRTLTAGPGPVNDAAVRPLKRGQRERSISREGPLPLGPRFPVVVTMWGNVVDDSVDLTGQVSRS